MPEGHRDALLAAGRQAGLPLALHYPQACHQHPHVIRSFGPPPELPHTRALLGRILSLPLHPYLEERHLEQVCTQLLPLLDAPAPRIR
ncbi:DegT/DnrJ/EryC1/StrS family aminotransferase [Synechococcus sp. 1G10]|uniref:DegT/DnrJ/EryC1/StrS family aminotransferase n=1 Tax=Synechococcus sp. 1G10 TaxID=2025605 RepID=UPI002100A283|nr:DegT/DnrJ/EryC1/StrS family aminotransferase [Synechococcus sp. 1G10]